MIDRTVFSWAGGVCAVVGPIGASALGIDSAVFWLVLLAAVFVGVVASLRADQFPNYLPPLALSVAYPLSLWVALAIESTKESSRIELGPWTLMILAAVAAALFAFRAATPTGVMRTMRNIAVGALLLGLPLYGIGLYLLPAALAYQRGLKLRNNNE